MNTPKISVIMPAYNQEKYIGDAIKSVIGQTYDNWELIVVDDGSVDRTAEIIVSFSDQRIRCIRQPNRGVCEARNLGICEADGEYIAFLDADDQFHPEKLMTQVKYLKENSEVGLVFVSRIEIDQHGNPLNFYSYDGEVTLRSVIFSFPFAPSDLMLRRDWLDRVGGFNKTYVVNEDREWYIRLLFAGCCCKNIKRFLSYRRLDSHKTFKDLPARMNDMCNALESAFSDPRCPPELLALKNQAYLEVYLVWSYQAVIQGEIDLARSYYLQAIAIDPDLMDGDAVKWASFMFHHALRDGGDHEGRLRRIFEQFTEGSPQFQILLDKLIIRGYLMRGIRESIWGRYEEADRYFKHVTRNGIRLDEEISSIVTDMLINYEATFGLMAVEEISAVLFEKLKQIFGNGGIKVFASIYSINQAFDAYRNKNYPRTVRKAFRAVLLNPSYIFNKGILSILLRSIFRRPAEWFLLAAVSAR